MVGDVGQHNAEAHKGDHIAYTGVGCVCDCTLDRREDCAARYTHDQDASSTSRVASKIGRSERKDRWIHRGLEEEDRDKHANGRGSMSGADVRVECNGTAGVDHNEEIRLQDCCDSCCDKATNRERDQAVRKTLCSLGFRKGCVLGGVVDEERGDGDLRADIAR